MTLVIVTKIIVEIKHSRYPHIKDTKHYICFSIVSPSIVFMQHIYYFDKRSLYFKYMFSARLRKPQDGLFTGEIEALDTVNNTYRISFDKPGLGAHSVSDIEVLVGILS